VLYHMASFPVTLSDFNYYKPPIFAILYRLSYRRSGRDTDFTFVR